MTSTINKLLKYPLGNGKAVMGPQAAGLSPAVGIETREGAC